MEWTYTIYSLFNYCICIGLGIIILVGVLVIFFGSKKGKEFVTERIIGVDPSKADDEDDIEDEKEGHINNAKQSNTPTKRVVNIIGGYFCFLAILTLTITAILIFQGCVLMNTRILPNDGCPDYPVDCFVFNGSSHEPINESISFHCNPTNHTYFPDNLSDPTALCFGWIIRLQTTKEILDQLGVCTGLLGLFTTLLAIIIYLGKTKKNLILCLIFIACCITTIVLLIVYKWSFSPLSYAVLILGAALGIFGVLLFCILPKRKTDRITEPMIQSKTNERSVSSIENFSPPPHPRQTTGRQTKFIGQSSKVTPQ